MNNHEFKNAKFTNSDLANANRIKSLLGNSYKYELFDLDRLTLLDDSEMQLFILDIRMCFESYDENDLVSTIQLNNTFGLKTWHEVSTLLSHPTIVKSFFDSKYNDEFLEIRGKIFNRAISEMKGLPIKKETIKASSTQKVKPMSILNDVFSPINVDSQFVNGRKIHSKSTTSVENTDDFSEELDVEIENKIYSLNDFRDYLKSHIFGIDEQLDVFAACVDAHIKSLSITDEAIGPFNMILAGPSGCGKTETYRTTKKYFEQKLVPMYNPKIDDIDFDRFDVYIADMTDITEEGYKGKDKSSILMQYYSEGSRAGIIFLDEIDKKLLPSHNSSNDDTNAAVQNGLLKMLEGEEYSLDEAGGKKLGFSASSKSVDTSKILFVGMGAFEGIEEFQKDRQGDTISMGFGATDVGKKPERLPIVKDDICNWGAKKQLMGRFCTVLNYPKPDLSVAEKIIDRHLNSLIKLYPTCEYGYSDKFVKDVANKINTDFGVRAILDVLKENMIQITYREPKDAIIYFESLEDLPRIKPLDAYDIENDNEKKEDN